MGSSSRAHNVAQNTLSSPVWWHILYSGDGALARLRQEDGELQGCLGYRKNLTEK